MLPYILGHTPLIIAWFWRWLICWGLTHFDLIYSCWDIAHSVDDLFILFFSEIIVYTKHNHSIWLPTLGHNHYLRGDHTFFSKVIFINRGVDPVFLLDAFPLDGETGFFIYLVKIWFFFFFRKYLESPLIFVLFLKGKQNKKKKP